MRQSRGFETRERDDHTQGSGQNAGFRAGQATWSPDGKCLVAMAREPLWMATYSVATKEWRTLFAFSAPDGYYAWSPDSRYL
ncbi:MAG TPA: hypothetical protein VMB19_12370 [Silvibacterium sp.]|nr:hypothetical protein [Silvibacterium sp.]